MLYSRLSQKVGLSRLVFVIIKIFIVGGGLAGLTVATYLARAGCSVILFEKAPNVGGRAITHHYSDFLFNQGPHALYRGGAALKILRELGIEFSGGVASTEGVAILEGKLYQLPSGVISILSSGLLKAGSKLKLDTWLASVMVTKPTIPAHLTLREWLEVTFHQPDLRTYIEALARLLTYANAPLDMSAAAFMAQLQVGLRGVSYLDGGWQTLIDGLKQTAQKAGVLIKPESRVVAIEPTAKILRLADDSTMSANTIIVAGLSPAHLNALVDGGQQPVLQAWAAHTLPVQAACLDLGLSRLPVPDRRFAVGVDQPLYFSVHSVKAKLGPSDGVMLHAAKYLDPHTATDAKADECELEAMLDLLQPGWRGEVIERRFLPKMTVSNAVVSARQGGLAGRPGPQVPGLPDLYVVGDWVGPEGMLLDAALPSAKNAAQLILNQSVASISTLQVELV